MNLNDWNWKNWSLVLLIALGGSLELIKRIPNTLKPWDDEISPRAAQTQPYSVRKVRVAGASNAPTLLPAFTKPTTKRPIQLPSISKEQMTQLAAKADQQGKTEFNEGKDKAAEAKKKKLKEDEWEIVVDPLTGKRIKRRKKKALAKKDEVKEEKKIEEEKLPDEDKLADNDQDIDRAIAYAVANGQLPATAAGRADDAFVSAEEWMRRLLSRPDLTETRRFIEHFNKHLVSTETFYKVVNAMITDKRPQMKQLGVLALGSTTPSVLNFQLLAQVIKSETGTSPAKTDAEKFVNTNYQNIARLKILEQILTSSTGSFGSILAMQKLEPLAQQYLGGSKPAPAPGGGASQASRAQTYTASFQRFVPVLTKLTQSGDASVKEQASRTLNTLQNLLQNSGTPVAPAVQASLDFDQQQPQF